MSKKSLVTGIVLLVILLDQVLKIWIKTTFEYNEEIRILGLSWARLHFIENPGMAFGLSFGGDIGKLLLSIFRIGAVALLIYIISSMIKDAVKNSVLISFALILGGAVGNIIDSAFYGLIFSDSYHHIAEFMPEGGGYGRFLHGKVVDMLYFPLVDTYFPDGWPVVGGRRFQFFRPVFNLADAAISTGVISLLVFNLSFFKSDKKQVLQSAEEE